MPLTHNDHLNKLLELRVSLRGLSPSEIFHLLADLAKELKDEAGGDLSDAGRRYGEAERLLSAQFGAATRKEIELWQEESAWKHAGF